MKSKADHDFWRCFNHLPARVQQLARKNYALWLANPFHPSLHFKRLDANLWSGRVGNHYRATGYFLTPDVFCLELDWHPRGIQQVLTEKCLVPSTDNFSPFPGSRLRSNLFP